MIERPLYFGEQSNLLGVLTAPDEPMPGAPAVVLLNAGLLHRVGPNRLHVDVARNLSARGFSSLRFDMSGVGDSDLPGGGSLLDIERSRHDVVEAIDMLGNRFDFDRFVVMGLCTGAFNAFRAALIDDRIVGCALLDGYSYPTLRSNVQHYGSRVVQLDRWKRYLARRLGRSAEATTGVGGDVIVFENEVVTKDRFEHELRTLLTREAQMLLIYTGLGPLSYYYERQIFDAFPDLALEEQATVHFYPKADHTFTLPGNRQRLIGDIERWMMETFTPAAQAGV
jgi:pimeloyl-ACP methyl ester carboxylesterase